ncbi:MAG: DNA-3-methyladenine glycosylase 2 family protein [Sinobacteraceae bacterium]|nr:DNA-3-methyladenine glycosylase 2 family protein [Nevskiaceae bacterium]
MIPAETLRHAEAHLRRRDRRLARLIEVHGPCTLGRRRRDPFHVLCTSIISQQLSSKAADTIQARVEALTGTRGRLRPAALLGLSVAQLRTAGLSTAKAKWLHALAQAVDSGALSFRRLRRLDDQAAIEVLDELPGIGRWTAEMFLIFALDRLDIFSLADVGLRRGLSQLHNGGAPLDDDAILKLTARWAPYRSVASWYLWRIADGAVETWA